MTIILGAFGTLSGYSMIIACVFLASLPAGPILILWWLLTSLLLDRWTWVACFSLTATRFTMYRVSGWDPWITTMNWLFRRRICNLSMLMAHPVIVVQVCLFIWLFWKALLIAHKMVANTDLLDVLNPKIIYNNSCLHQHLKIRK